MNEMTISHFKENNRTVVTYRTGEKKTQVSYSNTGVKAAEKRFRSEFGLRGKKVKKTIFEH